jgi:hypothetical protein
VRELVGDDGRRIAHFMLDVLEDETEGAEWFNAEIRRLSAAASEP